MTEIFKISIMIKVPIVLPCQAMTGEKHHRRLTSSEVHSGQTQCYCGCIWNWAISSCINLHIEMRYPQQFGGVCYSRACDKGILVRGLHIRETLFSRLSISQGLLPRLENPLDNVYQSTSPTHAPLLLHFASVMAAIPRETLHCERCSRHFGTASHTFPFRTIGSNILQNLLVLVRVWFICLYNFKTMSHISRKR